MEFKQGERVIYYMDTGTFFEARIQEVRGEDVLIAFNDHYTKMVKAESLKPRHRKIARPSSKELKILKPSDTSFDR